MILSSLLLMGVADAAIVQKKFCYKFISDLDDAANVGDDYLTSNGNYAAGYAYANIWDITSRYPVHQAYLDVSGCTPYIGVDTTHNSNGNTCRIQPRGRIPWNFIESGLESDGDSNQPFSCEGAENASWDIGGAEWTTPPIPVQARDLYGQFCEGGGGDDFGRGVSVDWLRYWWDFNRSSGIGFLKATQVVAERGSNDWCADGHYANGSVCPQNTRDWPAERLEDAMAAKSLTSVYNNIKDNGVAR